MIVLFFVNQNATLIRAQNNNNNQIPVRPTPFVENVKTDDQYVTRNKHIEKIKPLTIYIFRYMKLFLCTHAGQRYIVVQYQHSNLFYFLRSFGCKYFISVTVNGSTVDT